MHFHNSSYVIPLYYKETENAPLRGVLAEFVIIFVWMTIPANSNRTDSQLPYLSLYYRGNGRVVLSTHFINVLQKTLPLLCYCKKEKARPIRDEPWLVFKNLDLCSIACINNLDLCRFSLDIFLDLCYTIKNSIGR